MSFPEYKIIIAWLKKNRIFSILEPFSYDLFLSHKYFKLFLLIIGSLWILLKSPLCFIPLLNELDKTGIIESNPKDVYFFYLEFISWIIAFIPCVLFIFSPSGFKSFISQYRLLILAFINFFYALFRTFKTFDVTDTGFHFTKAWGLFHGSVSENIDFLVGTSVANGLWLSVLDSPSVLWARLGYVIVVTGIAVVSFKIYSLYFNGLTDWLIFLILSVFFIHYNYYLSVNYDNLPVLSALGGLWFLLKEKKGAVSYILSGILLALTIWLKFNFVFIMVLPVVYAWILYEKKQRWLQPLVYLFSGYCICLVAGILILYDTGYLQTYAGYLDKNLIHKEAAGSVTGDDYAELARQGVSSGKTSPFSDSDSFYFLNANQRSASERMDPLYSINGGDSHNLTRLFQVYFRGAWNALQKGAILSVLLFILLLMLGESLTIKRYIILTICAFSIHYTTYLSLEGPPFIYMTVSILPGYFFYIFYLRYNQNLIMPTALILMLTLFSFPGSNLSFNVIYRSGAGLLFIVLPLAFMIDKRMKVGQQTLNMNNYVIIFMVVIMFGIVHPWGYNRSHRDLGDRSVLVQMFKSPQLFGIHTFPQRTKVIDEALEYFNNETYERNNTPALFLSWIPMMYYLTQTNCQLNNPWHGCISFSSFKKEFNRAAEIKRPVYITFSKVMTRNFGWPLDDKEYRKKDKAWIPDLKKFDYIRYWMKDKSYSKVFENDMFEVYKKI